MPPVPYKSLLICAKASVLCYKNTVNIQPVNISHIFDTHTVDFAGLRALYFYMIGRPAFFRKVYTANFIMTPSARCIDDTGV